MVSGRVFRAVVIDESTQATEPATLVPLTKGAECVIMAGGWTAFGSCIALLAMNDGLAVVVSCSRSRTCFDLYIVPLWLGGRGFCHCVLELDSIKGCKLCYCRANAPTSATLSPDTRRRPQAAATHYCVPRGLPLRPGRHPFRPPVRRRPNAAAAGHAVPHASRHCRLPVGPLLRRPAQRRRPGGGQAGAAGGWSLHVVFTRLHAVRSIVKMWLLKKSLLGVALRATGPQHQLLGSITTTPTRLNDV